MIFNMVIGIIVEIEGKRIIVETNEQSNDLTYFDDGVVYRGVCVGQFIGIIRGPYILVARIEKEYLEDQNKTNKTISYSENRVQRKLEVSLIGYFENARFNVGIVAYPMIYNSAIMLNDDQISSILNDTKLDANLGMLTIGNAVKEKNKVNIDATRLFNTHIGIFGNTGSGKSNTLAKIYTELFRKHELNLDNSKFLFIDFNGEYTGEHVFDDRKKVIALSTGEKEGKDKISMSKVNFWNIETLSVLFSATEKTQKPFLKNAIDYYLDKESYEILDDKIIDGIGSSFYNTFNSNSSKETNKLLHLIYDEMNIDAEKEGKYIPFYNYHWHEVAKSYYDGQNNFISTVDKKDILNHREKLELYLKSKSDEISLLSITQRMKIAIYSHLIYCISYGSVQYDHISPMVERLKSRSKIIDKLIKIDDNADDYKILVVSLRNCNTDAKKIIPLLLVKNSYNNQKNQNDDGIKTTFHLIIDEAHNILSEQSSREEASWKDYRLETFEEVIKEGRKFGYYVTIASQRPADISETIVSQLHNYFIHRLISEQDLRMINNTVNTLDNVSKNNISLLAPGQCVMTGTSFRMPIIIQVTMLDKLSAPNSASADLERMWLDNK